MFINGLSELKTNRNMKFFKFIVYFSIIVSSYNVVAQQKCDSKKLENSIVSKSPIQKDSVEWKEIKLDKISFCLPNDFKLKEIQGIDLSHKEYQDKDVVIKVFVGKQSPVPSIEQSYLTYKDQQKYVNGIYAWLWFYEEKNEYRYIRGGRFFLENKLDGAVFTIYVKTKEDNMKELAESIISSIKLKSK